MSKPKAAAKAVAVVDAAPKDWPPGLVEKEVESFFRAIESGEKTVRSAASLLGKQGSDVYRMAREFPLFAKRLEEAVDIGCLMAEDMYREITAQDKNTAAAAMVKFTAIDRYLKVKRPKVYNTSTFKPASDENDMPALVGVVLVPLRSDHAGQVPQRPVIEGSATQVQRLPTETGNAPAFQVRADE